MAEEVRHEGHPSMVGLGVAAVEEAVQHEELLEEPEECHAV